MILLGTIFSFILKLVFYLAIAVLGLFLCVVFLAWLVELIYRY